MFQYSWDMAGRVYHVLPANKAATKHNMVPCGSPCAHEGQTPP